MKLFYFSIFFVFLTLSSKAQIPDFFVFSYKGDITYTRHGSSPAKIQSKTLLYKSDILLASDGSVVLVDADENFFTLDISNRFELKNVTARNKSVSSGIFKKYFHFVWEEFLHHSADNNSFLKSRLQVIGGQIKSAYDSKCRTERFPPEDMIVGEKQIYFSWSSFGVNAEYRFHLLDRKGQPVFTKKLKDTSFILAAIDLWTEDENEYFWKVSTDDTLPGCSGTFWQINLCKPAWIQKMISEETKIDDDSNSLLATLKLTDRLFEKKMYLEVFDLYESLLKKYPHDKQLIALYGDCLASLGLYRRASRLIKESLQKME